MTFPTTTTTTTKHPDLPSLALEAHAISRAHGFWDDPPSVARSTNLIHSEISELLEDLRDGKAITDVDKTPEGKPVGPASELADIAIRLFDFAGGHGLDLVGSVNLATFAKNIDIDHWIADLHRVVVSIALVNESKAANADMMLARKRLLSMHTFTALALVYAFALAYNVPLDETIQAKMDYNRTRPHKHGKAF
jgi:hypothetical protein